MSESEDSPREHEVHEDSEAYQLTSEPNARSEPRKKRRKVRVIRRKKKAPQGFVLDCTSKEVTKPDRFRYGEGYNGLFDKHLVQHFEKPLFRRQLLQSQLIN